MQRISSFFLNGLYHKNNTVNSFFKNELVSNTSGMLRNINTIQGKLKMKYADFMQLSKQSVRKELEKNEAKVDWGVKIIKELLDIRENQLECSLNPIEVKELLQHISIFR